RRGRRRRLQWSEPGQARGGGHAARREPLSHGLDAFTPATPPAPTRLQLASDRGALPETLGEAGFLFTIPERCTPTSGAVPVARAQGHASEDGSMAPRP